MMEQLMGSSGMTSRISADQEETSNFMAMESKLCDFEWTNEKHSLYLKNMEATFVNQLYKSIDLVGWRSQNNVPSKSNSLELKETGIGSSCSQFKMFPNGGWSKINFGRDEPELLANPWIRYYRCSGRKAIRVSPSTCAKESPTVNQSHQFRLWRRDYEVSNTEVTDQNFNDEDLEEEKNTGRLHKMKRKKTSTDEISCNDQDVLLKNIVRVEDVAESNGPNKD